MFKTDTAQKITLRGQIDAICIDHCNCERSHVKLMKPETVSHCMTISEGE